MRFGKKNTTTTKIVLIVVGFVVIAFATLVLIRTGVISIDGLFSSPEETQIATQQTPTTTLISGTPSPTQPLPIPGTPLVTATIDTPIYSTPGDENSIIDRLSAGQSAEASGISPDGLWWQIIIPNGDNRKGWVSNQDVIAENTENVPIVDPDLERTPEVTSEPGNGGTVTAETNVNIRSGPGILYEKIGLLNQGQKAQVVGVLYDASWWYIKLPESESDTGWVSNDYVTAENTDNVPIVDKDGNPISGQLPIPTPGPSSPSITALVNVNIRSGPSVEYEIVGLFLQGRKAGVVGTNQDSTWWAIYIPSADNGRGWVSADYVIAENTEDVPIIEGP